MKKTQQVLANSLLILFHIVGILWLEVNCAAKLIFARDIGSSFDYIPTISTFIILGVHYWLLSLMHKRAFLATLTRILLTIFDVLTTMLMLGILLAISRWCLSESLLVSAFFYDIAIQLTVLISRVVYCFFVNKHEHPN